MPHGIPCICITVLHGFTYSKYCFKEHLHYFSIECKIQSIDTQRAQKRCIWIPLSFCAVFFYRQHLGDTTLSSNCCVTQLHVHVSQEREHSLFCSATRSWKALAGVSLATTLPTFLETALWEKLLCMVYPSFHGHSHIPWYHLKGGGH